VRAQRILVASEDELAAHALVLTAIEKESRNECLWLKPAAAPEAAAASRDG